MTKTKHELFMSDIIHMLNSPELTFTTTETPTNGLIGFNVATAMLMATANELQAIVTGVDGNERVWVCDHFNSFTFNSKILPYINELAFKLFGKQHSLLPTNASCIKITQHPLKHAYPDTTIFSIYRIASTDVLRLELR